MNQKYVSFAYLRFNYATRFALGSAKHTDYMQLAWAYLFIAAGAPVFEER